MVRAELKVIGGKQHGSLIPLQTKKFLVGREQDCQLRPSSESVSRHHCVFTMDEFSVRLRDLGSTNGTFVNGQRVQGQAILQPGDRILIGKLEFEIAIHDSVAAVNYARATPAPAFGSSSDAGFMLNELAEMPEPAPTDETLTEIGRTKILDAAANAGPSETSMLSGENTTLMPPTAPPSESELPVELSDTSTTLTEIPAMVDASAPPTQAIPPMQPGLPAAMAPQGMPMPGAPMMSPYGMPGAMPGAYPQPTYLQAPYANYPPQYMPNPYGMQQPFMPQPGYMDPAYQQQMAYQQAMAQQAMMAQYAAQPAPAPAPEVEEPEAQSKFVNTVPISLPPPEETGAKPAPPPPPPRTEGTTAVIAAEVPNRQVAADILKKFMNRG